MWTAEASISLSWIDKTSHTTPGFYLNKAVSIGFICGVARYRHVRYVVELASLKLHACGINQYWTELNVILYIVDASQLLYVSRWFHTLWLSYQYEWNVVLEVLQLYMHLLVVRKHFELWKPSVVSQKEVCKSGVISKKIFLINKQKKQKWWPGCTRALFFCSKAKLLFLLLVEKYFRNIESFFLKSCASGNTASLSNTWKVFMSLLYEVVRAKTI